MRITNKKARFNFEILDTLETGIVLTGGEVKSIKSGRIKLDESFVRLGDGELWLVNANIPPYQYASQSGYNATKSRKLLAHRHQILALTKKIEGRNLTLVALACYNKGPKIKIQIGIGKGRKQWEKREKIRRADIDRDTERNARGKSEN